MSCEERQTFPETVLARVGQRVYVSGLGKEIAARFGLPLLSGRARWVGSVWVGAAPPFRRGRGPL